MFVLSISLNIYIFNVGCNAIVANVTRGLKKSVTPPGVWRTVQDSKFHWEKHSKYPITCHSIKMLLYLERQIIGSWNERNPGEFTQRITESTHSQRKIVPWSWERKALMLCLWPSVCYWWWERWNLPRAIQSWRKSLCTVGLCRRSAAWSDREKTVLSRASRKSCNEFRDVGLRLSLFLLSKLDYIAGTTRSWCQFAAGTNDTGGFCCTCS